MAEDESLCLRILAEIERIIESDPFLKDFCIVEMRGMHNDKNKSPVLYEEHSVALEGWCIKHIYSYAYKELFKCRPLLKKNKLSTVKINGLNKLLIGVLLIQPDVSTFWNMKRELVTFGILDPHKELKFAKLVLSYKPKSNEAFAYRKWCIFRLLKSGRITTNNQGIPVSAILSEELQVCETAANHAQNNYHAWNHRIWTMQNLLNHLEMPHETILCERNFSLHWTLAHVSEHAGFHYRQFTLKLVKEFPLPPEILDNILEVIRSKLPKNSNMKIEDILGGSFMKNPIENRYQYFSCFCVLLVELLNTLDQYFYFANHETIWYHRRFVIHTLLEIYYEYHGLTLADKINLNDNFLSGDRNIITVDLPQSHQSKRFQENGEHFPKIFKSDYNNFNNSYLYEILETTEKKIIDLYDKEKGDGVKAGLAARHDKWLKCILNFSFE